MPWYPAFHVNEYLDHQASTLTNLPLWMPQTIAMGLSVAQFMTMGLVPVVMAFNYCPPTGPLLPQPVLHSSGCFMVSPLTRALHALTNGTDAPFNTSTTSFSLMITTPKDTIFEFHHTASDVDQRGVRTVDGDSVYRVASVTKMVTVLAAMLEEGLDLDASIGSYIVELADDERYKEVTLRLLASHVAGVPP